MPAFLGHATLPNGEYEMIGDTPQFAARSIPGSAAEFAATKGASGTKPPSTVAAYRAGWLFARTGWGERRPYADETFLSFRWGRAIIHGHPDAGAITLYGYGARLLIDPGLYSYNLDRYRRWFTSRSAHNVVTVDGVEWNKSVDNPLIDQSTSATMVTARLRLLGNRGTSHVRAVTFSRNLGYVLVEDRISSRTTRTFRQLWHLMPDARPDVEADSFATQRERGNVEVRQLVGGSTSRVVSGRSDPVQGWVSWKFGVRIKAPVVEVIRRGTNVRYLTLISPAAGQPAPVVSELELTKTGYSVVVTIDAKSERVVVDGSKVSITPLN
jgi:hypothetical protein